MKIPIPQNMRGILFKNGKYVRMLEPGLHRLWRRGYKANLFDIEDEIPLDSTMRDILSKDTNVQNAVTMIEVPDESIALHYIDGRFAGALSTGQHAFWNFQSRHEFSVVDIREPMASSEITPNQFSKIHTNVYKKMQVEPSQKGRLYYNGKFVKLLDEGTYYFWNNGIKVEILPVDTRLLQMNVQGQEMLTLDKVALRINFVCRYRITDFVKVFTEIDNYEEQIHVLAQLALREYIGRSRLDELLENKEDLANFVLKQLKERETQCFVAFFDAGVKDIVLPGEIRAIMNTVLIAEKRAQANVITRREEVASTRSLLNTAKLMEENPTLLHLKEMECLEKICENVGNITVSGAGDLLSQLTSFLKPSATTPQ